MTAYMRQNVAVQPPADQATLRYALYLRHLLQQCQSEPDNGSAALLQRAVHQLMDDLKASEWHRAHFYIYRRACAVLKIPCFPITTRKLLLRLIAAIPGARAATLMHCLPVEYQQADLRLPPRPPGSSATILDAFHFIHARTNAGWEGWPANAEISPAEWASFGRELEWIDQGLPAYPYLPFGAQLDFIGRMPAYRVQGGKHTMQVLAAAKVNSFLATHPQHLRLRAIFRRHEELLASILVPTYPIIIDKIVIDLARRVDLPASVEIYNGARRPTDELFRGYWARKDVREAIEGLCTLAAATASLWPSVEPPRMDHPMLVAMVNAAVPDALPRGRTLPPVPNSARSALAQADLGHGTPPRPHPNLSHPQAIRSTSADHAGEQSTRSAPATPQPRVESTSYDLHAALYAPSPPAEDSLSLPTPPNTATATGTTMRRVVSLPTSTSNLPSSERYPPTLEASMPDISSRPWDLTKGSGSASIAEEALHDGASALGWIRSNVPVEHWDAAVAAGGGKRQGGTGEGEGERQGTKRRRLEGPEAAEDFEAAKREAILGFCEGFVRAFGGAEEGQEKEGEGTLREVLDELRGVVQGIEWLKVPVQGG